MENNFGNTDEKMDGGIEAIPAGFQGSKKQSGKRRFPFWVVLVALGLILLIVSIFIINGSTKPQVSYQRVKFTTEGLEPEPVTISGLLMKPSDGGAQQGIKRPGIVFAHGITGNKEWYIQLTRRLVLEGFVVLSIDFRGHGGSTGYCSFGYDEANDVLAAARYLRTNVEEIEPAWIVAMGHSLGGIISTRAGAIQTDGRISSVVAIYCWTSLKDAIEDLAGSIDDFVSRLWKFVTFSKHVDVDAPDFEQKYSILDIVDDARPPNYLLAIGSADELASVSREEEIIEKMTVRARSLGPEKNVKTGCLYGNFQDGSARKLFVSNDDHATELASGSILVEAVNWIKQSYGIPAGPVVKAPFLWTRIFGIALFAVSLFLMSLGALSFAKPRLFPGGSSYWFEVPWDFEGKGIREVAIYIVSVLCASYLAFPAAKAFGIGPLNPYTGVNELALFYLSRSIVLLPIVIALIVVLIIRAGGLKEYLNRGKEIASIWGRAAIYALLPFLLIIIFMLILSGYLFLPRALPMFPGAFIAGTILMGAGFWLEDYLFYRIACSVLVQDERTGIAVIVHGVVLTLTLMFAILPLLESPMVTLGIIKVPVLLLLVFTFPFFILVAWLSMRLRKLTGTSLAFVLMFMPLVVWVLTTQVSVRGF
ncbi:MAG: alpha/beta fold hydrolase [Actinomycetota bacterium]|nr:alpha/beta fold hydrolase [Actinomycetota bacterium]